MAWTCTAVAGRLLIFAGGSYAQAVTGQLPADGNYIRATNQTGFLLKDGTSKLVDDMLPGMELINGKVLKHLLPDGLVEVWSDQ